MVTILLIAIILAWLTSEGKRKVTNVKADLEKRRQAYERAKKNLARVVRKYGPKSSQYAAALKRYTKAANNIPWRYR